MATLGPDAQGIFVDGCLGLGQRLMRFTHEDNFEQQPLMSFDRKVVLVCDARIDNRPELTAALGITASAARQLPDSTFILRAYEKWQDECVSHLIGEYSFAIWNSRDKYLMLARSPLGGRPLYYHTTDRLFAFSSLPKALFTHPSIPRELNHERIADYLAQAPIESGTSFYRGIHRLHSGHLLRVDRHGLTVRNCWQPDLRREIRYSCDADYVHAFNTLLDRVVSDHLRSQSDVGVMMSGGLDSTAIAAVAAAQLKQDGRRLAAFTEVPRAGFAGAVINGRYADESPFVKAMSRHYDTIDLNLIRTDNRMYLDDLERFFDEANIPFRNASNRVWYEAILQAARKQGVRVLLTGAQGNLTISRSGQGLLPLLMRKWKWLRALHEARALGNGSPLRTLFGQGVMPLLPTSLFATVQYLRGKDQLMKGEPFWSGYSAINPEFARAQRVEERAREKGFDFHFRSNSDMSRTCAKMLPGLAMSANDINHAYRGLYGIDVRDPTADIRIVEFCLALPEEQYLKDGISRRLIRRAMAGRLPPEILENRQRGLQAADWFERLLAARENILYELGVWKNHELLPSILDLELMTDLLRQMPQAGEDAGKILRDYRQKLEFGLMIGRFILWFEHGESARA